MFGNISVMHSNILRIRQTRVCIIRQHLNKMKCESHPDENNNGYEHSEFVI